MWIAAANQHAVFFDEAEAWRSFARAGEGVFVAGLADELEEAVGSGGAFVTYAGGLVPRIEKYMLERLDSVRSVQVLRILLDESDGWLVVDQDCNSRTIRIEERQSNMRSDKD